MSLPIIRNSVLSSSKLPHKMKSFSSSFVHNWVLVLRLKYGQLLERHFDRWTYS